MMNVPFLDLKSQNRALKTEIMPLWEQILESAGFIGGEHVTGFEKEFAAACGVAHSALVNSGTDALRFIFIALGLEAGDEVITVPNTFIATTEAITQAGGRIVFVDIDPETYTLDPAQLHKALSPRTKGIVPVHLFGQPADMTPILDFAEKHGLWVVEDACQAHLAEYKGKKAGAFGIAGAFSFYPGKNLGACGEGGAVTTNDPAIADRVRILRDHGQARKYHHDMEGYNGRCDALQAAALRVKLKKLPAWNADRNKNAKYYNEKLIGNRQIWLPVVGPNRSSVYHLFVVQIENRDKVQQYLNELGIGTGLHYPVPLHLQKAYTHMGFSKGAFPIAEKCAERILSLPMFPEMTSEQIEYVADSLKRAVIECL